MESLELLFGNGSALKMGFFITESVVIFPFSGGMGSYNMNVDSSSTIPYNAPSVKFPGFSF
jgi:hypothetical protein